MKILRSTDNGFLRVDEEEYGLESELEKVVISNPFLLETESDRTLEYVCSQFTLPRSGRIDVLLLDSEGLPVLVEVKLSRNPESQREIVGQVLDYMSSLVTYTVDELNKAVGGEVEKVLGKFAGGEENRERLDKLWDSVGVNLRAGKARFVLVVDRANESLERIMHFLAQRSSLDVRLVEIRMFREKNGNITYVPRMIVGVEEQNSFSKSMRQEGSGEILEVVGEFEKLMPAGFTIKGGSPNFRYIRPDNWRPNLNLHYEFYRTKTYGISVELHLESDLVKALAGTLIEIAESTVGRGDFEVVWDPKWARRGKLIVKLPENATNGERAAAMSKLIALTKGKIDAWLAANNLLD